MKKMTTEQEDTWLAALFDGEGGFNIGTDTRGYNSFKMYITQSHCDRLLELVKEKLGFGWVEPAHAWRCGGNEACVRLLNRIEPYLVVKKSCAELFRQILGTIRKEGRGSLDDQFIQRSILLDKWEHTCTRRAQNARNALSVTVQELSGVKD
jgi:hypothetical protein